MCSRRASIVSGLSRGIVGSGLSVVGLIGVSVVLCSVSLVGLSLNAHLPERLSAAKPILSNSQNERSFYMLRECVRSMPFRVYP